MEALTAAERDFEQAAVYWKQKAEEYRLAGLADKARMDWLEELSPELSGRVCVMEPLTRRAIDAAMKG